MKERIGMTEAATPFPVIREAVASFPDREHFHRAVGNLLAAGFGATDLSVLASHDSLAAAHEPGGREPKLLPAGTCTRNSTWNFPVCASASCRP